MHMADALVSPVVGGVMLAATAGLAALSIKRTQNSLDQKKIPLMGIMGAFIFAAQMINFTIPGTGSSGHIGGGLILAVLLGPSAGFLTMAAVLLIQALFFADGGLLAYGCNVFNLGFFTCFIAYPLIFRLIVRKGWSGRKIWLASIISAIFSLQLGAFSVVLETLFSGKTELPFSTFVLMIQPIHLAIGIVEGLVTASVVHFIWKARPEIIEHAMSDHVIGAVSMKKVLAILAICVVMIGGGLSWFASANPDGLEWSINNVSGSPELQTDGALHKTMAEVQAKTAFLPDYAIKPDGPAGQPTDLAAANVGKTVSGLAGAGLTLALVGLAGFLINLARRRSKRSRPEMRTGSPKP
jgi:cobalt/nickel transport system permease protein